VALAVLSKGPVALVLFPLTLALFWGLGADGVRLWRRLRPLAGLLFTLALSAPWDFGLWRLLPWSSAGSGRAWRWWG
jgi:4-amino-4-deoxy-L-arabinose transferase-like glycosyltransferase